MAGESVFARRKRLGQGRSAKDSRARELNRKEGSAFDAATPDAIDVARYAADMTSQLEAMANAAHLDLLAYFLGMAKAESELFVRTNAPSEAESSAEEPEAGPSGDEPRNPPSDEETPGFRFGGGESL